MKFRFYLTPALLLTASCMLGPDFQLPGVTGGEHWKEGAAVDQSRLPDRWWRLYDDSSLNRLVERSLEANNDLAAAKSRVDTARALVGIDQARLFPTLDLAGSAGINRSSGNVNTAPGAELEHKNFRGSFNLAFDPDLWGRNKRLLESSTADAAAVEARYDSFRLGLATEVTRQYFVLRGLDEQKAVLQDTLKSRQDALDIQKTKTDAGLTDGLATSSARTELELARNDLANVERQRGAAEHALAVLCGTRPADFDMPVSLGQRPLPVIRPGLPASVLARRPDVRAAVETLRSANAQIGVAEANFYPNFSLTGAAGLESLSASNFLDWESRILSLGAGAAMPIFEGGANKSRLEAAKSEYEVALAEYRQTLLVALREVEDSLVDLQGLVKSRSALEAALASAKDTRQLTQERYDEGLTSYLDVVNADRTVLQIRLSIAVVDAQQHISLAALAKALGGGWSGK
jgi:multidrug efflux system outer membrane protein